MTFTEFVDQAGTRLLAVGGKVMQRREADPEPGCWWVPFRRAAVLYRMRFDRGVATLFFEREQGSFVANSATKWQYLDCREPAALSFEGFLDSMDELVQNRWIPKPAA